MSLSNDWSDSQYDWREFTSLACLLSLRNERQFDPTPIDEVGELDELDDLRNDDSPSSVDTASTDLLSPTKLDALRKRFLDRLAELFANERGGTHVSSVVMKEDEREDRVDIWIARNCGFEKGNGESKTADGAFSEKLENALRSASQACTKSPATEQDLWQAMLEYYNPRLKSFRKDLKDCLLAHKAKMRKCLARAKESLTESQRNVQALLREISEECHRRGPATFTPLASETLVMKCFQMRQLNGALSDLEKLLNDSVVAQKLHVCMCFLGRLRAAHHTLFALATASSAFSQFTIHCVPRPEPIKYSHVPLTIFQTFNLLELGTSEALFQRFVGTDRTLSEENQAFGKLQKQRLYVHAEIQLLHHIARSRLQDMYPYIGGSKRSCFLCASFIKAYGGFETRGSHGRLYSKWLIPRLNGIDEDQGRRMMESLRKVHENLKRQLRAPVAKHIARIPESSIGLTEMTANYDREDPETNPSMEDYRLQRFSRECREAELRQLQQWLEVITPKEESMFEAGDRAMRVEGVSDALRSLDLGNDMEEVQEIARPSDPEELGYCDGCETPTRRTCSKCGRDRYCSLKCEGKGGVTHAFTCSIGRPLHTGDFLIQDCLEDILPTDPDVEEDFGFHRLYSFPDKAKLLGLYKGLFYLDVSPESLNEWRETKSLAENIIATFSKIPAESRGSYYPWFLDHQYILDGRLTTEEALREMAEENDAEARTYLDPQDRNKSISDLEPPSQRSAFQLLRVTLLGAHPRPAYEGPYYDFGFCTCVGERAEMGLGGLYQELLLGDKFRRFWSQHLSPAPPRRPRCSFDEFWRAFDAGRLIELMDRRGLKARREGFQHLDTFLHHAPHDLRPSVWSLQAYLNDDGDELAPGPVLADYGFMHCRDYLERTGLKEVYRDLLRSVDHLALHQACIQGKLWSFASEHMTLDLRFKKLMRNLYPLSYGLSQT